MLKTTFRDSNIYVDEIQTGVYHLRIGDFGIARKIEQFAEEFASDGFEDIMTTKLAMTNIGTAYFMAPEITLNEVYNEKVDCFAFGKLVLRCHKLCGFIKKENVGINRIKDQDLSKRFVKVLESVLDQEPEYRFSANQILEELGVDLNLRQNHGEKVLSDGRVFTGEFQRFKMNGKGRMVWKDGTVYEGQFKNDKMAGLGTKTWPNGKKYIGQFEGNTENGEGQIFWPKKSKYNSKTIPKTFTGMFQDGQIKGEGKLYYHNTDFYHEGQFDGQKIKGPGKRIYDKHTVPRSENSPKIKITQKKLFFCYS